MEAGEKPIAVGSVHKAGLFHRYIRNINPMMNCSNIEEHFGYQVSDKITVNRQLGS